MCDTIAPLRNHSNHHLVHRCYSRVQPYCFPPLNLHSQSSKRRLSGRNHSDPPQPVFEVYRVFSNRVLLSSSGRQPRATAKACIGLGVSWTSLTNKFKKSFSCLVLRFFLDSLRLLQGSIYLPNQLTPILLISFFKSHISFYFPVCWSLILSLFLKSPRLYTHT